MKATRWIGMLLVVVLLTGLLPVSAFAAPSGTMKATATLESHFGEGGLTTDEVSYTDTAYFSDSWFTKSSFKPNPSLATLSAITGGASYANGENQAVKKFIRVLEAFGFQDVAMNDYYSTNTTLQDSIGCIMGRKTIRDGSGSHTLLAVFFRNAGYRDEWYGDFNIGESGIHADFLAARDEALRFMKQYVETHKVSGDVKVWAAGYSRGAAVANLLGGFLAEEKTINYLKGVSIKPENVFVYAIATPRIIPANMDRKYVWSVAGPRTEASYRDHDTAGTAFIYTGTGTVDPGAVQYRGIHNYTAYGDYVTKLPPEGDGWGFTRYGTTEMVEYGSTDMRDWLDDILGAKATAETFVGKNYLTPLPERTFDVSTLKLVETGDTITPDAMISERFSALMGIAGGRAGYVDPKAGYQNVLGSAAAIFGKDMGGFSNGVRQATTGTLAKAAVLNYLAYALELQKETQPELPEQAGVAETLMQILEYVGIKKSGDHAAYTDQQMLADVLDFLVNDCGNAKARAAMVAEKLPKEFIYQLVAQIAVPLYTGLLDYAYKTRQDVEAYAISGDASALTTIAAVYACSPDAGVNLRLTTVDDLLYMLSGFITDVMERDEPRYSQNKQILQFLLYLLDSKVSDLYKELLVGMVGFFSGETYKGFDDALLALARGFVTGFQNPDPEKQYSAGLMRGSFLPLFQLIPNLPPKTYELILNGVQLSPKGGEKKVDPRLLTELVNDVLDMIFKKEEEQPRTTITDAADAALRELIALGRTDKIGAYIDILEANPAALRKVAGAILFRPGETYDLASDVKNAVTFIDIIPFLVPAHYHELYISSLKTKDQNYQAPDVPPYYPAGASEPGQSNPFRDISKTDACYDAVLWAYYHQPQITSGVTETTFVPGGTVKRGEAITFLWRAMGCPEPAGSEADCPFTDLTQDYYKKAVRWGYESGIIKGVTETTFDPEQPLSTAHIATFLYRTLNPGADGWYTEAAGWLTAGGYWKTITLAIDTGTDCPRAQAVMALYALRGAFDKAA